VILNIVNRKNQRTLQKLFAQPVLANIKWADIEVLFKSLGAVLAERTGSRVEVILFSEIAVFHRPHPSPDTEKGAVAAIRKWLEQNGVRP
jgi:hypothetical protein